MSHLCRIVPELQLELLEAALRSEAGDFLDLALEAARCTGPEGSMEWIQGALEAEMGGTTADIDIPRNENGHRVFPLYPLSLVKTAIKIHQRTHALAEFQYSTYELNMYLWTTLGSPKHHPDARIRFFAVTDWIKWNYTDLHPNQEYSRSYLPRAFRLRYPSVSQSDPLYNITVRIWQQSDLAMRLVEFEWILAELGFEVSLASRFLAPYWYTNRRSAAGWVTAGRIMGAWSKNAYVVKRISYAVLDSKDPWFTDHDRQLLAEAVEMRQKVRDTDGEEWRELLKWWNWEKDGFRKCLQIAQRRVQLEEGS